MLPGTSVAVVIANAISHPGERSGDAAKSAIHSQAAASVGPGATSKTLKDLEETLLEKASLDGIEQAKSRLSALMQKRNELESSLLDEVS